MTYGYYPGCALGLHARAHHAYHLSTLAVAKVLGLELAEVPDWNCCGATEYFSVDLLPAYALVARNLALAAEQGHGQVVAPCSACYLNLTKTDRYMADSAELNNKVNLALAAGGLHYTPGSVRVRHLLEVVFTDVGPERLATRVTRPLTGLRVAPYYGCMTVRPAYLGAFDNPEHPTVLDQLLRVLGAKVVDYPLKAQCCGGHMTQISEDTALELLRRLLKGAADYDTDVMAALCPMCQLNLDGYQDAVNRHFKVNYHIPILYFTQLLGLALGLSDAEVGLGQEFVDARPALARIGAERPAIPASRRRAGAKDGLPMPSMPEEV